uniref:Uncharacterized protein n=1 Tax=Timema tahoe TaxID=61484 RepID=A0A7R9NZY8_9NEOP|nr:unnamed protein product [Timema tahoe]
MGLPRGFRVPEHKASTSFLLYDCSKISPEHKGTRLLRTCYISVCDIDEEQVYFGPVPALSVTERRGTSLLRTCYSVYLIRGAVTKRNSSFRLSGTGCECDVRGAVIKEQASQFRPSLVSWMSNVAERMKLCNTTVHLSIYILDVFMDNHSITTERLILVALVCLLLAAKFEERDMNVPKIHELNQLVQNQYPTNDFILLEIMTLKFLHWNLVIPTVAHFVEYYVTFTTLPSDLKNAPHFSNYSELQCYAYDYVKDYLDESLKDVTLHQYQPSLVAASCIAATRLRLHLNPKWTSSLCEYTSYEFSDLQQCVQTLMGLGSKRKLEHSPDNGYATEESSPDCVKQKRLSVFN